MNLKKIVFELEFVFFPGVQMQLWWHPSLNITISLVAISPNFFNKSSCIGTTECRDCLTENLHILWKNATWYFSYNSKI